MMIEAGFTGFDRIYRMASCLNLDLQDLRIYRIGSLYRAEEFDNILLKIVKLSESGFTGFEDLQDRFIGTRIEANNINPENPLILKMLIQTTTHAENPASKGSFSFGSVPSLSTCPSGSSTCIS
jgi:hypothetical protein